MFSYPPQQGQLQLYLSIIKSGNWKKVRLKLDTTLVLNTRTRHSNNPNLPQKVEIITFTVKIQSLSDLQRRQGTLFGVIWTKERKPNHSGSGSEPPRSVADVLLRFCSTLCSIHCPQSSLGTNSAPITEKGGYLTLDCWRNFSNVICDIKMRVVGHFVL